MTEPFDPDNMPDVNIKDYLRENPRDCEISKSLPGIACEDVATTVWGHGALISVCDFHAQLPPTGTETQLLTALYELEKRRGRN